MSTQLGIFVTGANGRMGKTIIQLLDEDSETILKAATEHAQSPAIGIDAGVNAGIKKASVLVSENLKESLKKEKGVIIDFSAIESSLSHIKLALEFKTPIVIGTTGFSAEQIKDIKKASLSIPIVFAPNMSVGMNLMFKLVGLAANVLKEDYDIEVFEAHHKKKKDSPSGTANRLAQILCESSDRKYPDDICYHREGMIGERDKKEIGMQVLRGGDIVGEHTVFYCGEGERVEIKHVATSRSTFAKGAIRAAKWLAGKNQPGLYDMWDVLGLKSL